MREEDGMGRRMSGTVIMKQGIDVFMEYLNLPACSV